MCHFAVHPGFVDAMVANGQFSGPTIFDEIELQFCIVNGCQAKDYRRHRKQAQRRYGELERVAAWTIDFGPYAYLVAGAKGDVALMVKPRQAR
jgi:hypothetical protein